MMTIICLLRTLRKEKQLETRLKNLEYDTEQDDNIYFENLGVDALFVDEAHNFKNLSINTKLSRIAGIQTTESKRSEDLLLKIQYIKRKSRMDWIVALYLQLVRLSQTHLLKCMS
ncbi:MAG: hypothetical protein ACLVAU_13410 [Ruminococcus sp.]